MNNFEVNKTYYLCLEPECRYARKVKILDISIQFGHSTIKFEWLSGYLKGGINVCQFREIGIGNTKSEAVNNYRKIK